MRFLSARGLALVAAIPALFVFSVIPGCSNQGEGDRCGSDPKDTTAMFGVGSTDSADCSDGLVCVQASSLLNADANRCCYPDHVSNSRCAPAEATASTAGTGGGSSASGGAAGTADQTAGAGG